MRNIFNMLQLPRKRRMVRKLQAISRQWRSGTLPSQLIEVKESIFMLCYLFKCASHTLLAKQNDFLLVPFDDRLASPFTAIQAYTRCY